MKRHIIFRGLSPSGEWFYGDLENTLYHCRIKGYEKDVTDGLKGFSEDVNEETVGQYTGVYDIADRNIYEGDVLLGPEGRYTVEYKDGSFYLVSDDVVFDLLNSNIVTSYGLSVIGNIHQGFLPKTTIEEALGESKKDSAECESSKNGQALRFNLGDEAWFMDRNKAEKSGITSISIDKDGIRYEFLGAGRYFHDNNVFKTKEELLKSL